MDLTNKQITFYKPGVVQQAINQGIRALTERYDGSTGRAVDHCINIVDGLSEARLTHMRSQDPPGYTRNGQSFVTLVWVLLVDGMLPYRRRSDVREWLAQLLEATDLFEGSVQQENLPQLVDLFTRTIQYQPGSTPPSATTIRQTLTSLWTKSDGLPADDNRHKPIFNRLFLGRQNDLDWIYQRIGIGKSTQQGEKLTIIRGWPGVGKTAFINTIVHDDLVTSSFEQGILWASVGKNGDAFQIQKDWCRQLGLHQLAHIQDFQELRDRLRSVLTGQNILLVVDDIWTDSQGFYFKNIADLKSNTLILTTRFTDVANSLADIPDDVYVMEPLSQQHALDLLAILAPEPVKHHQKLMPELIQMLEGLPLALRVAGPLLQHYYTMGFSIDDLVHEFATDYRRLLDTKAPADRVDEETGQTPTIALLFKRSVDTLPAEAQLAFALLGILKEKPATFNMKALRSLWTDYDAEKMALLIVGRGLMEPTRQQRYWVHQTLHMYANKLLVEFDNV